MAELTRVRTWAHALIDLTVISVLLDGARLQDLYDAGLDHVQLSFQDTDVESAERIGNFKGAQARKLELAAQVRALGLPLTVNVPFITVMATGMPYIGRG